MAMPADNDVTSVHGPVRDDDRLARLYVAAAGGGSENAMTKAFATVSIYWKRSPRSRPPALAWNFVR